MREGVRQGLAWAVSVAALALAAVAAAPGRPRDVAVTLALAVAGAGLVRALGALRRRLPVRGALPAVPWAVPGVVAVGAALLGPGLLDGGRAGDFGVHRVVVETLAAGLARGALPGWTHLVGAGMPLDLYPRLAYLPAALLVWPFGLSAPAALSVVATVAHVALSAGAAAVARRVAGEPWAFVFGALALVEHGPRPEALGAYAIFRAALFHHGLAMAAFAFAAAALLDGLAAPAFEPPRRAARRSVRVALLVALAVATHPLALVSAATALVAAVGVALFARDVSPLRAWLAARDVVVGLLVGGVVWVPLVLALGEHGLPFGSSAADLQAVSAQLVRGVLPHLSLRIVAALACVGAFAGLASRRAAPWFLAALAVLPILLYVEEAWTLTGLAPSPASAGFPAQRMGGLARPFVYALAALGLSAATAHVRGGARPSRLGWGAAALAGAAALLAVRAFAPTIADQARAVRDEQTAPAPAELDALVSWARREAAGIPEGRVARVLVPRSVTWEHAVAAASGLPIAQLGYAPGSAFRDHPSAADARALRRYDVRWIWQGSSARVGPGGARIGPHGLVAVPGWDGALARVEGGTGAARLRALDDARVVLDVTSGGPVDVVLGLAWWPRWRATGADGRPLAIDAVPAYPGAESRVIRVRAPPGRVVLRCDRFLPRDGAGLVALALGLVGLRLSWLSHARWRLRVSCRRLGVRGARWLRWARPGLVIAAGAALALAAGALALAGGPAASLQPAGGPFAAARVEVRVAPGRPWLPCAHDPVEGVFRCPGGGRVGPALVPLFSLRPAAWPSVVPATGVEPGRDPDATYRVRFPHRLRGLYRVGRQGIGEATLTGVGPRPVRAGELPGPVELAAEGTAVLVLRPGSEALYVAVVRNDTLGSIARPPAAAVSGAR